MEEESEDLVNTNIESNQSDGVSKSIEIEAKTNDVATSNSAKIEEEKPYSQKEIDEGFQLVFQALDKKDKEILELKSRVSPAKQPTYQHQKKSDDYVTKDEFRQIREAENFQQIEKITKNLDGFADVMKKSNIIFKNSRNISSASRSKIMKSFNKNPELLIALYEVYQEGQKVENRKGSDEKLASFQQKGLGGQGSTPVSGGSPGIDIDDFNYKDTQNINSGISEGLLRFNRSGRVEGINPDGKRFLRRILNQKKTNIT